VEINKHFLFSIGGFAMYYNSDYGFGSLFRDFARLRREMGDLLEGRTMRGAKQYPALNIWTGKDKVMVTSELPGITADELEISVRGNALTLEGKPKGEDAEHNYHRRERPIDEFYRTVELPCNVDADKVEARLEKGILAIALPRAEADKPRKISVKSA
jgi:HSP20 family protein